QSCRLPDALPHLARPETAEGIGTGRASMDPLATGSCRFARHRVFVVKRMAGLQGRPRASHWHLCRQADELQGVGLDGLRVEGALAEGPLARGQAVVDAPERV